MSQHVCVNSRLVDDTNGCKWCYGLLPFEGKPTFNSTPACFVPLDYTTAIIIWMEYGVTCKADADHMRKVLEEK